MDKWPLFCYAKTKDDASCATDAISSPLDYLTKSLGSDWKDKTQDELDKVW